MGLHIIQPASADGRGGCIRSMIIPVRVKPNSKEAGVTRQGDIYVVKVDAPATDGRANERLVEILAGHFRVKKSQIVIKRGRASRNKVVEIS